MRETILSSSLATTVGVVCCVKEETLAIVMLLSIVVAVARDHRRLESPPFGAAPQPRSTTLA